MAGRATNMEAVVRAIGPDACRTTAEISDAAGLDRKAAIEACCKLVVSELIERVEVGCFRLTPAGRDVASGARIIKSGPRGRMGKTRVSRSTTLRQRAWAAMRLQKRFAVTDIVTLAATGRDNDPEAHLVGWFRALTKAGYLAELPRRIAGTAPSSPGYKCWVLLRDTGEMAPLVRLDGTWHDHNTGEDGVPCSR